MSTIHHITTRSYSRKPEEDADYRDCRLLHLQRDYTGQPLLMYDDYACPQKYLLIYVCLLLI